MYQHERKLYQHAFVVTRGLFFPPSNELPSIVLSKSPKKTGLSAASEVCRYAHPCVNFLKQYPAMSDKAPCVQQVAKCTQHEMTRFTPIGVNWWLFTSECALNTHICYQAS